MKVEAVAFWKDKDNNQGKRQRTKAPLQIIGSEIDDPYIDTIKKLTL